MKKIFVLLVLVVSVSANATKLLNFDQAAAALTQGQLITFVVQFDKCVIKNSTNNNLTLSQHQVTYRPQGVLYNATQGLIMARGMTYSDSIRAIPSLSNVNQAYTYVYAKNGELHITNRFLDPATFKPQFHPIEFTCKQGKSFEIYV